MRSLPREFRRYAELFVGGGALFWRLAAPGSLIADSNEELINFYRVVRDRPCDLVQAATALPVSEEDYYRIRRERPVGELERAARLAYLNKTCYNGLYRVNRQGDFNTPWGRRSNVTILTESEILPASLLLRETEIVCSDFADSARALGAGDFVYLDPPYVPAGGYADFTRYTAGFFGPDDQERLARLFGELTGRGVLALLSNSATDEVRALYAQYTLLQVEGTRQIACTPASRGAAQELLIANYPVEVQNSVA